MLIISGFQAGVLKLRRWWLHIAVQPYIYLFDLSLEFKIYVVKEFQRLKEEEQKAVGWSAKRELAKINYHIHTDAIKQHLIPPELTPQQVSIIYTSEADVLNMALFGMTAAAWCDANPDLKGNICDYATINELIYLSNMENINAVLISESRKLLR
jgi:hypothetical protein